MFGSYFSNLKGAVEPQTGEKLQESFKIWSVQDSRAVIIVFLM